VQGGFEYFSSRNKISFTLISNDPELEEWHVQFTSSKYRY